MLKEEIGILHATFSTIKTAFESFTTLNVSEPSLVWVDFVLMMHRIESIKEVTASRIHEIKKSVLFYREFPTDWIYTEQIESEYSAVLELFAAKADLYSGSHIQPLLFSTWQLHLEKCVTLTKQQSETAIKEQYTVACEHEHICNRIRDANACFKCHLVLPAVFTQHVCLFCIFDRLHG